MHRAGKVVTVVIGVFLSALWFLFSFRLLAFPLLVMLLVILIIRPLRRRRVLVAGTWIAFLAATILPFDVTLRSAPGRPHFVSCCPGQIPYRDHRDTVERDRRGECRFCTDLFTGAVVGPRYWLVW